ncbi:MAG: DUF4350 domain-containing protein [Sphingomonadales bacterium]|nr:DUF4350 domain-containing protein [Sphingomonadales bacterium]
MTAARPGPFGARQALALVLAGTLLFLGLVWALGSGGGFGRGGLDNGGGHGAATGFNGFAGFARLLAADGWSVATARGEAELRRPGLLVLTPPADADGKAIARIVAAHRPLGPTLVIAPKWVVDKGRARGLFDRHPGWVQKAGVRGPEWPGFLDDVRVRLTREPGGWRGLGLAGALPDAGAVIAGEGGRLMPLVVRQGSGAVLAAAVADAEAEAAGAVHPLVVVFEPDLIDNHGLRDPANAALAEALAREMRAQGLRRATFDLTLNGLALPDNLLRLAVTPPYLAATLCLLLAALAVGWRAFVRFGPALAEARDVAFGKAVLIDHAGALIVRSGRMRLLAGPYAALLRERVAKGLGLARGLDAGQTDAAIDRALRGCDPAAAPFSESARTLAAATREGAVVAAARRLHDSARKLMR